MPRTILTDDVIERKCPEYQPLSSPNAFFDDIGGALKSPGIKPVPFRPPPRPGRLEYLSSSARIPLDTLRTGVLLDNEIIEPILEDLPAVVEASAPPYDYDYVAPRPLFEFREALEEKEDRGPGEEPVLYGDPVNLIDTRAEQQELERTKTLPEKFKALMGLREATQISKLEGMAEEMATEILPPSKMTRTQSEEKVEEARKKLAIAMAGLQQDPRSVFYPTKYTIDHRTPVSQGVAITKEERNIKAQRTRRERKEARIKTFGVETEKRDTRSITSIGAVRRGDPLVSAKMEKQMERQEQLAMAREEKIGGGLRGFL